jgi:hypothetical protein
MMASTGSHWRQVWLSLLAALVSLLPGCSRSSGSRTFEAEGHLGVELTCSCSWLDCDAQVIVTSSKREMERFTIASALDTPGDCRALVAVSNAVRLSREHLEIEFLREDGTKRVMLLPRYPWETLRGLAKVCISGEFHEKDCAPYFRVELKSSD